MFVFPHSHTALTEEEYKDNSSPSKTFFAHFDIMCTFETCSIYLLALLMKELLVNISCLKAESWLWWLSISIKKKVKSILVKCKQRHQQTNVYLSRQTLVLIADSTLAPLKKSFVSFSFESLGIYNVIKQMDSLLNVFVYLYPTNWWKGTFPWEIYPD